MQISKFLKYNIIYIYIYIYIHASHVPVMRRVAITFKHCFTRSQNGYYTEWATKKQPAFRFARVLATVLIPVFTLCYGPWLLFLGPSCI